MELNIKSNHTVAQQPNSHLTIIVFIKLTFVFVLALVTSEICFTYISTLIPFTYPGFSIWKNEHPLFSTSPFSSNEYEHVSETAKQILTGEESRFILRKIFKANQAQEILNLDKFSSLGPNSSVIVIQVHSRLDNLKLLVRSLSRAKGIEDSLIIFSHDLYLPEINDFVRKIEFTRVLQIFYPFMNQLFPDRFPGPNPFECYGNMTLEDARRLRCRNAELRDRSGRYRDPAHTQLKHHWWWKASFVFEKVNFLANHSRVVVMLEDDNYVAPDFLWILQKLEDIMTQNQCFGCNIITGTHLVGDEKWDIACLHAQKNSMVERFAGRMNVAMAFNRTYWTNYKKSCAQVFCEFDDWNWDTTFYQTGNLCYQAIVLHSEATRVFHIGDCGVHHSVSTGCHPEQLADKFDKTFELFQDYLYPEKLTVEPKINPLYPSLDGIGGFGDIRDQLLCRSF